MDGATVVLHGPSLIVLTRSVSGAIELSCGSSNVVGGIRADADIFEVARSADADNLVYGHPYRLAQPSYKRAVWAGLAEVSTAFAALVFSRLSRMASAFASQASTDAQAPPLAERYFARQQARSGRALTRCCTSARSLHCPWSCVFQASR